MPGVISSTGTESPIERLQVHDANQAAALVPQMADRAGIIFMRTTREKTPVVYAPGEEFPIGGARVARRTDDDAVPLVAAGISPARLFNCRPHLDFNAAEGRVELLLD